MDVPLKEELYADHDTALPAVREDGLALRQEAIAFLQ
jgi:hypothetical protein